MQDQMKYQKLQPEDRMTIAIMTQQGCGVRAKARARGRSASTISREISRNSDAVSYCSHMAQLQCVARRQAGRAEAKCGASGARGCSSVRRFERKLERRAIRLRRKDTDIALVQKKDATHDHQSQSSREVMWVAAE
jgi:IS30 family transposase